MPKTFRPFSTDDLGTHLSKLYVNYLYSTKIDVPTDGAHLLPLRQSVERQSELTTKVHTWKEHLEAGTQALIL
jgi:hypothetical protein